MEPIRRSLECELSDREVGLTARSLAQTVREYDEMEAEKKQAVKEYGEGLKTLRKDITKMSHAVRSKKEYRLVECLWRLCLGGQTKELIRQDTGDVVEIRVAEDSDRQVEALIE